MHGEDPAIKRWLQERMERAGNEANLSREEKLRILGRLTDAETLETFLHRSTSARSGSRWKAPRA